MTSEKELAGNFLYHSDSSTNCLKGKSDNKMENNTNKQANENVA